MDSLECGRTKMKTISGCLYGILPFLFTGVLIAVFIMGVFGLGFFIWGAFSLDRELMKWGVLLIIPFLISFIILFVVKRI